MPLDGLTLKVLVNELNERLRNGRILKIYQPTALTVTLHLRLPGETQILLISANAEDARLHTIKKQPENPAAPPSFCMLLRKYLEPSRLIGVEQQGTDRIVRLRLESINISGEPVEYTLVFELLGRHTNLYLLDQSNQILDAIKRFPEAGIIPGGIYQPPSDQGKLEPDMVSEADFIDGVRLEPANSKIWRWLQNTFQGFSKTAAQEVVRRAGLAAVIERSDLTEEDWVALYNAFQELLSELDKGGSPGYYPLENDFAAYRFQGKTPESYDSTDALIASVLGERSTKRQVEQLANSLKRRINTHYRRVLRKEEIQKTALLEAEQADQWRHRGELLTANFHLLKPGLKEIEVADYTQEDQPQICIELDPLLQPAANVQRIFKRYHKEKASQKHTARQLRRTRLERRYLEGIILQLEMAESESILQEIEAELTIEGYLKRNRKRQRKPEKQAQEPARYLSADGLPILVGRNNRQNDLLTFKMSSPRHLWLHARNQPGSHVIILAEEEIPPKTLEQAALLAAYFSKGRSSSNVAVDYTLRRHVRKPRGAKPGFVRYEQAQTIFVNPDESKLPTQI